MKDAHSSDHTASEGENSLLLPHKRRYGSLVLHLSVFLAVFALCVCGGLLLLRDKPTQEGVLRPQQLVSEDEGTENVEDSLVDDFHEQELEQLLQRTPESQDQSHLAVLEDLLEEENLKLQKKNFAAKIAQGDRELQVAIYNVLVDESDDSTHNEAGDAAPDFSADAIKAWKEKQALAGPNTQMLAPDDMKEERMRDLGMKGSDLTKTTFVALPFAVHTLLPHRRVIESGTTFKDKTNYKARDKVQTKTWDELQKALKDEAKGLFQTMFWSNKLKIDSAICAATGATCSEIATDNKNLQDWTKKYGSAIYWRKGKDLEALSAADAARAAVDGTLELVKREDKDDDMALKRDEADEKHTEKFFKFKWDLDKKVASKYSDWD